MSNPIREVVGIISDATNTSPPSGGSPTAVSTARDHAFGTRSELTNHEVLEGFLNTTLNRKGGYATFDFEDPTKTVFVELKTRRIRHDQYPTALIGLNKVRFCEFDKGVQYWFAFCYTDGLYVIQYDRDVFANFEINPEFRRGDRPDAHDAEVVYIPVELLKRVDPNTFQMERPAVGGAGAPNVA